MHKSRTLLLLVLLVALASFALGHCYCPCAQPHCPIFRSKCSECPECIGNPPPAIDSLLIVGGGAPTHIDGNMNSPTLILESLSSSLIVSGCATNLASILIKVPSYESSWFGDSDLVQNLVRHSGDPSCPNLSSVVVTTTYLGNYCDEITTKTSITKGQLYATHHYNYACESRDTFLRIFFFSLAALFLVGVIALIALVCSSM